MAAHSFVPIEGFPGLVLLGGSFTTDGAGVVASTRGRGFTAARVGGAGTAYRVTLADPYFEILTVLTGFLAGAGGADAFARIVAIDRANRRFDVQVMSETGDVGVATDTKFVNANLVAGEVGLLVLCRQSGAP